MNEVEVISAEIEPQEFFNRFINTRKIVKFRNQIHENPWNVNLWSNNYLKEKAGKSIVKVEFRESSQGRFGKGNEKTMEFGEFIDKISSGDQRWYLTTQKLDYSAEGQPMIVSHPITELLEDIPLRPRIMGNLLPQNINLWMGSSDQPTTSGLHHDFHDNIYILLRGRKTLTLFPPSEYKNMYLVGKVVHLHPNGRFNYYGQPTRADGSCVGSEEALRASKLLDEAVLKLENEESGAEDEVENALEALLDAQTGGIDDGDDDFENCNESELDEGDDDEVHDDDDDNEDEDEDDESSVDHKEAQYLGLKREREHNAEGEDIKKRLKTVDILNEDEEESLSKKEPPSFSRVDTDAPKEVLEQEFPLFLDSLSRGFTVTLQPGEMLYIPAGWFHEVKSSGSSSEGGHMALNYWFHPPDGTSFEKPYESDFWENDWKERKLDK